MPGTIAMEPPVRVGQAVEIVSQSDHRYRRGRIAYAPAYAEGAWSVHVLMEGSVSPVRFGLGEVELVDDYEALKFERLRDRVLAPQEDVRAEIRRDSRRFLVHTIATHVICFGLGFGLAPAMAYIDSHMEAGIYGLVALLVGIGAWHAVSGRRRGK